MWLYYETQVLFRKWPWSYSTGGQNPFRGDTGQAHTYF
jgi:hypothetical protein